MFFKLELLVDLPASFSPELLAGSALDIGCQCLITDILYSPSNDLTFGLHTQQNTHPVNQLWAHLNADGAASSFVLDDIKSKSGLRHSITIKL
jgi:hypothetical protein